MRYEKLVSLIESLISEGKEYSRREVNRAIIYVYWHIGRYIVEFEQGGRERAKYGTGLIEKLSEDLTNTMDKGYSVRNLKLFRKFYLTFPKGQPVIAQSKDEKGQSEIALLGNEEAADNKNIIARNDNWKSAPEGEGKKLLIAMANLTWTHFVRLLSVQNEDERNFYIIETAENNWTVREMNRQINSSLFERILLSSNKIEVEKLAARGQIIGDVNDIFKEPYVLEFLGLEEKPGYSENELESAIIDKLEKFILELGKGFAFVSRQERISSESEHFKIDLVFYNRLLKSFVLIDLKIGRITHGDIGQMQMYINYYDREIKLPDENKTIGILLCKEKNDFVIKYTLPEDNKQIFAKEYQLYLPDKKQLKKLLSEYL